MKTQTTIALLMLLAMSLSGQIILTAHLVTPNRIDVWTRTDAQRWDLQGSTDLMNWRTVQSFTNDTGRARQYGVSVFRCLPLPPPGMTNCKPNQYFRALIPPTPAEPLAQRPPGGGILIP